VNDNDSIICADIGAVATKVGLGEYVSDGYRLIGSATMPSTARGPNADVSVGVRNALTVLEAQVGRRLIGSDGRPITSDRIGSGGKDAFVATTSAAVPLRVTLVGLSRQVSLISAQRAIQGTYAVLDNVISLNEEDARWGAAANAGAPGLGGASEAIQMLLRQKPEVIVLTGGLDGGAGQVVLEMANVVAALCAALDKSERPLVIFAGNTRTRAAVAERISPVTEFVAVDNVRPQLAREALGPLQNELARVFTERKFAKIPGLDTVSSWSPARMITSAQGLENVARFLAKRYAFNVLAVDLGAATTTLIAVKKDRVLRAIHPLWGSSIGLDRIIQQVGMDKIMAWVPGKLSTTEAHARLLNQMLHPASLPTAQEDDRALQAASRTALISAARDWREGSSDLVDGIDLCLIGGAPIARGMPFGDLALMILDSLELRGIVTLAADGNGLAAALGAMAAISPEAASQLVERDGYVTLGTLIAPYTRAREGSIALQVHVTTARGGTLDLDVQQGTLELLPLGLGERATVEILPANGVELGVPLQGGVLKREMEGGALGLVIDARGRPIQLPEPGEARREKIQRWLWDVGSK
jgi:hypothetical protein